MKYLFERFELLVGVIAGSSISVVVIAFWSELPVYIPLLFCSVVSLPCVAIIGYRQWKKPAILEHEFEELKKKAQDAVSKDRRNLEGLIKEVEREIDKQEQEIKKKHNELQAEYDELEAQKVSSSRVKKDAEESLRVLRNSVTRSVSAVHEHFDQLEELNEALHMLLSTLEKKVSEKAFAKVASQRGKQVAESIRSANLRLFKKLRGVEDEIVDVGAKVGKTLKRWKPSESLVSKDEDDD